MEDCFPFESKQKAKKWISIFIWLLLDFYINNIKNYYTLLLLLFVFAC